MNHFSLTLPYRPLRKTSSMIISDMLIHNLFFLKSAKSKKVLCETKSQENNLFTDQTVQFPVKHSLLFIFIQTRQQLFDSFDNQVTDTLLSCSMNSHHELNVRGQGCVPLVFQAKKNYALARFAESPAYTATLFTCDDDLTHMPYTLLCDFRQDCTDNSDESFCQHPSCTGFVCSNGQCVLHSQKCNECANCRDSSDEVECPDIYLYSRGQQEADKTQPLIINLDGAGYFTQQIMSRDESCPDTHYRCTEDWLYCLPVYTRCNGPSDCTYGEDEHDCQAVTCPGFYRCHASSVCVHADHLCDGWGQCPQRDDEWLCDVTCPEGCLCHGLAFLCSKPFSAALFSELRYLDAGGSNMTLTNLSYNTYLIWLSLSHCSLADIPEVELSNLLFIDLSSNQLTTVNINSLGKLPNLRVLILANNPLLSLTNNQFNISYSLRKLDLSGTLIQTFNIQMSMYLPQVKQLNVSFCAIATIGATGFGHFPQLTELDIRGNPVHTFPFTLLAKLNLLENVFSSNFRLCCESLLPKVSRRIQCSAPQPIQSSCTRLLPSELHRVYFWLLCLFPILGNPIFCWCPFQGNFLIFLAHFQFSNVCMAVFASIVSIANESFHGEYIHFEKAWTSSIACMMAAFLSFLSTEVSVLILCVITLDHVCILRFNFADWKFSQCSMAVVCVFAWLIGITLSVVPFLPGLSHWDLDGKSGLCLLALFDHYGDTRHRVRWFTVTVAFNCLLCCAILAGQIFISGRTPKYKILMDSTKRSVYSSAELLVKLAVTSIVCWFLFGLASVMRTGGVAVSESVYAVVAVFMVPLSPAVSPLLCIWAVAEQQRQEEQERKILSVLKARLLLSKANSSRAKH